MSTVTDSSPGLGSISTSVLKFFGYEVVRTGANRAWPNRLQPLDVVDSDAQPVSFVAEPGPEDAPAGDDGDLEFAVLIGRNGIPTRIVPYAG